MKLLSNCCSYLRHSFESHRGIKASKIEAYADFFMFRWSLTRKMDLRKQLRPCSTWSVGREKIRISQHDPINRLSYRIFYPSFAGISSYYLKKIIKDIDFVLEHTDYIDTQTELEQNEVLLDSVLFRLIQISENSTKLTEDFKKQYKEVPWHAMKGMRNRIVHDYGEVDLKIVYDTIKLDLPKLVNILEHI